MSTDLVQPTDAAHRRDATLYRSPVLPVVGRLAVLAAVLTAFALRSYHLDYQSFWSDEGISLLRSAQPMGELLQNMPVEHAPGYFVLLHGWMQLAGVSDFGIRYLSLLPGVWSVALIYRLAADLGDWGSGFVAAMLLATGSFQVWYAQEARMYTWLLASGLLATWALWILLRYGARPHWVIWTLYVVATAAALYIHYFGFLIPILHAVIVLVWLVIWRKWRPVVPWLLAGVSVFLVYLPWWPRALQLLEFSGWREPENPRRIPWLLLHSYSAGETMPAPWSTWLPWVYAALAVWGVIVWLRRDRHAGSFVAAGLGAACLAAAGLILRNPDFHVRYTIFFSLPLYLAVCGGIAGIDPDWIRNGAFLQKRGVRDADRKARSFSAAMGMVAGVLAVLVVANGVALQRLYHESALHKPDFRGAAHAIQSQEKPGDIILVDGPNPDLVFLHYYTGAAPVFDLRHLQEQELPSVAAELEEIIADAERVWEVLFFHPPEAVQVWLATQTWPTEFDDFNGIRVGLYGVGSGPPQTQSSTRVRFGSAIELTSSALSAAALAPGDLLRVTTSWQTIDQPADYKFSLRLVDSEGIVVRADDYVPQNWFAPTSAWTPGATAEDRRGILLPEDLSVGQYGVTLRLYDPTTGEAVVTTEGVDVVLGEIRVHAGEACGADCRTGEVAEWRS